MEWWPHLTLSRGALPAQELSPGHSPSTLLSNPSTQTPREELPPAFIRQGGGQKEVVRPLSASLHPKPPTSLPRYPAFPSQDASSGDPVWVGGRRSISHRGLAQNTVPGQLRVSPRAGPASPPPPPPPVPPLPFLARISAQGWTPRTPLLWMSARGLLLPHLLLLPHSGTGGM